MQRIQARAQTVRTGRPPPGRLAPASPDGVPPPPPPPWQRRSGSCAQPDGAPSGSPPPPPRFKIMGTPPPGGGMSGCLGAAGSPLQPPLWGGTHTEPPPPVPAGPEPLSASQPVSKPKFKSTPRGLCPGIPSSFPSSAFCSPLTIALYFLHTPQPPPREPPRPPPPFPHLAPFSCLPCKLNSPGSRL